MSSIVDKILPELVFSNKMNFKLYSCEPANGLGKSINEVFMPNQYIDISEYFERKIELISLYTSQNPSYWISLIETQNAQNGRRVGKVYADIQVKAVLRDFIKL